MTSFVGDFFSLECAIFLCSVPSFFLCDDGLGFVGLDTRLLSNHFLYIFEGMLVLFVFIFEDEWRYLFLFQKGKKSLREGVDLYVYTLVFLWRCLLFCLSCFQVKTLWESLYDRQYFLHISLFVFPSLIFFVWISMPCSPL